MKIKPTCLKLRTFLLPEFFDFILFGQTIQWQRRKMDAFDRRTQEVNLPRRFNGDLARVSFATSALEIPFVEICPTCQPTFQVLGLRIFSEDHFGGKQPLMCFLPIRSGFMIVPKSGQSSPQCRAKDFPTSAMTMFAINPKPKHNRTNAQR